MTKSTFSLKIKAKREFQWCWKIPNAWSMGGLDIVTTKIFSLSLFLAVLQLMVCQISWLGPVCFSIQ